MTRSRLLFVFAFVLVALGVWLLLREDPEPAPGGSEVAVDVGFGPATPARAAEHEAERSRVDAPVAKRGEQGSPGSPGASRGSDRNQPLRGVVKEIQGSGIPDVRLELVDRGGSVLASTTTGAAGAFAFEVVIAGADALLSQPAAGALPRVRHPRALLASKSPLILWRPPVGVIRGMVIDAAGRAVAQAVVSTDRPFVPMGMMPWEIVEGPEPKMVFQVHTDSSGRFELPFAMQGAHRLRASKAENTGSVVCNANEQGVVLRLGMHHGGDVVLAGRLANRVTGDPIEAARVSVMRVRVTKGGRSANHVASVLTNQGGRYEVRGLEAGTYEVHAVPDGFAAAEVPVRRYGKGQHTVDLLLDPARSLTVRVVSPDGRPVKGVMIHVLAESGARVPVPGRLGMLGEQLRSDDSGVAELRRLPASLLTLRAVAGDLLPAGELTIDLRNRAPKEVSIEMPTTRKRFSRTHYFVLLGPDGKPANVEGTAVARSFDDAGLLSQVEGCWRGKQFTFGHEGRNEFSNPTIAVGAMAGACRVELSVPGYRQEMLTIKPGAKSPTRVQLRR